MNAYYIYQGIVLRISRFNSFIPPTHPLVSVLIIIIL